MLTLFLSAALPSNHHYALHEINTHSLSAFLAKFQFRFSNVFLFRGCRHTTISPVRHKKRSIYLSLFCSLSNLARGRKQHTHISHTTDSKKKKAKIYSLFLPFFPRFFNRKRKFLAMLHCGRRRIRTTNGCFLEIFRFIPPPLLLVSQISYLIPLLISYYNS